MKHQVIKKVIDHESALCYIYNDNPIGFIKRATEIDRNALGVTYWITFKWFSMFVRGYCYKAIKKAEDKLRGRYHNAIFVEGTVDDIPLPF